MSYSDHDLRAAAGAGAIGPDDLQRLLAYLHQRAASGAAPRAKFDAAHLLWYAGALIVIGAMGLFSTVAFSQMGGRALTACALAYALAFGLAGNHLWRRDLRVPGGLLIAIAVSMAPLAVYGVQDELGWWGKFGKPGTVHDFYVWIKGSWLFMEIATIAAGSVALRFYRVPFIVAIISVALWFMSMDLTPWIFNVSHIDWEMRRVVSIWFGLGILSLAWIVDTTSDRRDLGFWLHLFGLMAFWGGITATDGATELGKAIYCLLNVGLLLIAVLIVRRAYAVFGTIGITMYLGHLADVVFKDSLLFPFALSLIGVGVVGVGLAYHRKQKVIAEWLTANLPAAVLRLRPQGAMG
ncbi:hypothetical protein SSBR45G_31740 [Bradyrhizobium sp. SSBR45G]|uniref:hypothetical protein n=1 Tax=unclassified Bradyrhizobium TaxID=2631580 RepID=UPI0023429EE7|nr:MULTISPECIES: hypothetical protein [unclassified Bradyrhizobium]GLH78265.1 hypothetical protein SSBR45G_31740 [Bradyrhizobium sp. SSBR45G]GLH85968.1 hypothetical protein SSBR45R_34280 [Bradyrhizobium sp. SSBR45R]